jgi:hypothetical protein
MNMSDKTAVSTSRGARAACLSGPGPPPSEPNGRRALRAACRGAFIRFFVRLLGDYKATARLQATILPVVPDHPRSHAQSFLLSATRGEGARTELIDTAAYVSAAPRTCRVRLRLPRAACGPPPRA